jgi:hypothetical protein
VDCYAERGQAQRDVDHAFEPRDGPSPPAIDARCLVAVSDGELEQPLQDEDEQSAHDGEHDDLT